ncbi:odorant receptor 13a-like [Musca domestica]|uniref:Odorant receptor n=1 Tax=Musca domestica TaxID=7370 RepID=A0ABM3VFM5_MUSDO|nr:odorant receptor 13a-like [Musca domestica]
MAILYKPRCAEDVNFVLPLKVRTFLMINGCWPMEDNANNTNGMWNRLLKFLYQLWFIFGVVCLFYIVCVGWVYIVANFSDVKKVVEAISTSTIGINVLIRMIYLRCRFSKFKHVLEKFTNKIWINKVTHPLIFKRCIKRTVPTFYLSITLWMVLFIYCALPIFVLITTDQTIHSNDKTFPYPMIFPYDPQKPINYILTYMTSIYTGAITVTLFYATDAILAIFISFLCGQFEILHGNIARLIPECHAEFLANYRGESTGSKKNDFIFLHNLYVKRLHELATAHDELIRFSMDLEKLFSFQLMVNVVTSTFQICTNLFQFIVSTDTANYLFSCNWEGGILSQHSPLLRQVDYITLDSLNTKLPAWRTLQYYPTNRDFRMKLKLMIMRSQRPAHLTAMKFTVSSLESFTRILSTSMSYFTLLNSFLD